MNQDESEIRHLVSTWLAASASGDDATVLSLMSDDVVFLLPGQPPMNKQGFIAGQQAMKNVAIDGKADIQEVSVSGNLAYCWNNLTVTVTPKGGAPVKRAGNVLSILRKESGRWVILRDANMLTLVE